MDFQNSPGHTDRFNHAVSFLLRRDVCRNVSSSIVFLASLLVYWLTADRSASYWDCPEYITCASLLEVGHPPGNPVWMLAMRMATIPFPPHLHAFVINLCSGLFMALASFFLARIIFFCTEYTAGKYAARASLSRPAVNLIAGAASAGGALAFALSDSAWFSAVEAEVYAMSAFFTSLTVWLMLLWAKSDSPARRNKLIILTAYLTGLSLGIHQLNLLTIPVLALIMTFRARPRRNVFLKACGAVLVSFIIIVLILIGMMNGTLAWAEYLELFAVNTLGLPAFSGALAYAALLTAAAVTAAAAATEGKRGALTAAMALFLWLSGIFVFKGRIIPALALSLLLSGGAVFLLRASGAMLLTGVMSLAFILLGFSSYALILIRGCAAPPMNEGAPSDIFALSSYISRDQYGSAPLFYGPTPFSAPMMEETRKEGTPLPSYSLYALKKGKPKFVPSLPGARLAYRSRMLSREDSLANSRAAAAGKGYILSDYTFSRITTPELNMFFPRITSSAPADMESYESWAGMEPSGMTEVEISEAVDSLGNPVARTDASGERVRKTALRPTYLQNLRFFLSYQAYYMYFRYLLWNFAGRQNDIHSTGEIDHGNFITGLSPIDDAMTGEESLMPPPASRDNKGRNVFFCIPLLLGIAGIIFLASSGRKGRRTLAASALLFLMTGLAIVVYLNQSPGEPRERDYSFLGSFMAFSIWIGLGMAGIPLMLLKTLTTPAQRARRALFALPLLMAAGTAALMGAAGFDDHDRRGRSQPYDFSSILLSRADNAIIFTQGDNFTFPAWYAQEVMRTGQGNTVIDVSYFAMPEYVVNLMKQGERGIKLTATPADIAFGAYAFTRIAPDADTVPVAAADALRELYSKKDGNPVLRHRRLLLPGKTPEHPLIIDLRDFAGGSSMLPFKKLMLLDLLATNALRESPRPVFFHPAMASDFHSILLPHTRRLPLADAYVPAMSDSGYRKCLRNALNGPLFTPLPERATRYADPVIADQRRRQRGEMTITLRNLLETGDTLTAAEYARVPDDIYPFSETPAGSFTLADTTFHEGMEYARLLVRLSRAAGDRSLAEKSDSLITMMLRESRQWRRYYSAFPPSRRSAVSNATRRLVSVIPALERLAAECDSAKRETGGPPPSKHGGPSREH